MIGFGLVTAFDLLPGFCQITGFGPFRGLENHVSLTHLDVFSIGMHLIHGMPGPPVMH